MNKENQAPPMFKALSCSNGEIDWTPSSYYLETIGHIWNLCVELTNKQVTTAKKTEILLNTVLSPSHENLQNYLTQLKDSTTPDHFTMSLSNIL